MNGQISRTAKLEVPGGFTVKSEWEENYMIIREKAYEMGVKYPVIFASTTTGRVYVFEGNKTEKKIESPQDPMIA